MTNMGYLEIENGNIMICDVTIYKKKYIHFPFYYLSFGENRN